MKEESNEMFTNLDNIGVKINNTPFYKRKLFIIILLLIIVAILAVVTILILTHKDTNSNNDSANNENIFNYSIKAEYSVDQGNKTIELINSFFQDKITELIIDGEKKEPCTSYNFTSTGIHTVYFTINLEGITKLERIFYENNNLLSIHFSPLFNTENITEMKRIIYGCDILESVNMSKINIQHLRYFDEAFEFAYFKSLKSVDLSNIYAKNLEDFSGIFRYSKNLTFVNLSNFEAPNLWQMIHTFHGCDSLISVDLTNFKTPSLRTIQEAFAQCTSLTSMDLSNLITDNLTTMIQTFYQCYSLKTVNINFISAPNLRNLHNCFYECNSLTSINLSNLKVNVTDYHQIFGYCYNLSYVDISSFYFYELSDQSITLFSHLPPYGEIYIKEKLYYKIKNQIPEGWNKYLINNKDLD